MENLLFCMNATIPVFFTMLLGMFLKKLRVFDDLFVKRLNAFVFSVALPVLLFEDLSTVDFLEAWDTTFVVFCFTTTLLSILLSVITSFRLKRKGIQGEFVQASYRSSAAILGIALIENLYGSSSIAPLMILASVPLYNIAAVTVLSLMKPQRERLSLSIMKMTCKDIAKNPIILGIIVGFIWSMLKIPQPVIMQKTLHNIAVLATPLGLMAMGGSFTIQKLGSLWKPALLCSFMKLILFVVLFLPIAILLGFTNEKLVAILIMLGSASTVSCFIMAKNMGHDGELSSSVVMVTTLCSSFTLTLWLYILRVLSYI